MSCPVQTPPLHPRPRRLESRFSSKSFIVSVLTGWFLIILSLSLYRGRVRGPNAFSCMWEPSDMQLITCWKEFSILKSELFSHGPHAVISLLSHARGGLLEAKDCCLPAARSAAWEWCRDGKWQVASDRPSLLPGNAVIYLVLPSMPSANEQTTERRGRRIMSTMA